MGKEFEKAVDKLKWEKTGETVKWCNVHELGKNGEVGMFDLNARMPFWAKHPDIKLTVGKTYKVTLDIYAAKTTAYVNKRLTEESGEPQPILYRVVVVAAEEGQPPMLEGYA